MAAFSHPGDRVIIRGLGCYPGLAADTTALINAAAGTGRRPMALLPTPTAAARTRARLTPTGPRPAEHHPHPTTPTAATVTGGWARGVPGERITVGVGRRRPGGEAGPAALVVVLAGPLTPEARPFRARITPRLVQSWARPLRPGGLLIVLRPPDLGTRRSRPRQPHGAIVAAAQHAGLIYLQHIVLVHTPTTTGLTRPASTRRPHAPFWPVHTDALAFSRPPLHEHDPSDPDPPTPTTLQPRAGLAPTPHQTATRMAPTAPFTDPPTQPLPRPRTAPPPAAPGDAAGQPNGARR